MEVHQLFGLWSKQWWLCALFCVPPAPTQRTVRPGRPEDNPAGLQPRRCPHHLPLRPWPNPQTSALGDASKLSDHSSGQLRGSHLFSFWGRAASGTIKVQHGTPSNRKQLRVANGRHCKQFWVSRILCTSPCTDIYAAFQSSIKRSSGSP